LTKVFAAEQSRCMNARVLFIPLHLFDMKANLEEAVNGFFAGHDDVPQPVFDRKANYVLVFDGLDELVMQGESGPRIAMQFLSSLDKALQRWRHGALLAVVSGREVLLQAIAGDLRRHQVLRIAPFNIEGHLQFEDPFNLRSIDQRDLWWRRYGQLKGRDYDGMPVALQRPELSEINAQPLLNYVLALSYERGRVDFTAAPTINVIYHDLLDAIYERKWGTTRHPSMRGIRSKGDFERVLQEIALAAWDGNGRTTTVSAVAARCREAGISSLIEDFANNAREGVLQLLTAFYFRYNNEQIRGERTFEFIHKSFSEFLLAQRLVQVAVDLAKEQTADTMRQFEEWTRVTDIPFDSYVFAFIRNEIGVRTKDDRAVIRSGLEPLMALCMTLELPTGRTLRTGLLAARRASIALLAILSAAAGADQKQVHLKWEHRDDFAAWLTLMTASRADSAGSVVLQSLSHLHLGAIRVQGADLAGAHIAQSAVGLSEWFRVNLNGARLTDSHFAGSNWVDTHAHNATFDRSDLTSSNIDAGDWSGTSFSQATLTGARFSRLRLVRTRIDDLAHNTTFTECDLSEARFDGAKMNGARFEGCLLRGARFDSAVLDRAVFDDCIGLAEARFSSASMANTEFGLSDLSLLPLSPAQLEQLQRSSVQDELDRNRHAQ